MSVGRETEIFDAFMHAIQNQELLPGDKLPSEYMLAKQYHVPRLTVRQAFLRLEELGIVYSEQGKGRFVKAKQMQIELHLSGEVSFTEKMQQLGYQLETKNIGFAKIPFAAHIYQNLGAAATEAVYKISRLRSINGDPIALHHSYVRAVHLPMIEVDGPAIQSMFQYYREQGYTTFRSTKSLLRVLFPSSLEQELLHCTSMVPLLAVESNCIHAPTDNVLEYTEIRYRGDTFTYNIAISEMGKQEIRS